MSTPVDRAAVAIVGAGVMGVGIAQCLAHAGHAVHLFDPDPAMRATAPERIASGCAVAGQDAARIVAHVTLHSALADAVAGTAVVIEAGPESTDVKRAILAELDALTPGSTLIATNTSSIPLGALDSALSRPRRFLGAHFWHPPYLVPLVEVVCGPRSDRSAVTSLIGLLHDAGMRPIPVEQDVPGIVGNRLQHALKREAIAIVAAGVATAETVDTVVREGFGRRLALVGPLEQADLGGLDLTMAIHAVLMPDLDATPVPHPYLQALVENGDLGAKTGQGFYGWADGRADRRRAEIAAGLVAQPAAQR